MGIRRANRDDARAIAEVHVRAWRVAYRGLVSDELLDGLSVEDRESIWLELLSKTDASSFTLVAIGGADRIDGLCTAATPSRDDDAGERTAEIAATYVDPSRWRSGVGAALMGAALDELRLDGYEEVTLWVFAENDRARSFYRTLAFRPDGRETRHDQLEGQLAVRLRAPLPGLPPASASH